MIGKCESKCLKLEEFETTQAKQLARGMRMLNLSLMCMEKNLCFMQGSWTSLYCLRDGKYKPCNFYILGNNLRQDLQE